MNEERLARGNVWLVDLDPIRGHEHGGRRPGLIVSEDDFNAGPGQLVVIVPLTTRSRPVVWRVPVDPPEGGLRVRSFAICEGVRSVSRDRLLEWWGAVSPDTLAAVGASLRVLLDIPSYV